MSSRVTRRRFLETTGAAGLTTLRRCRRACADAGGNVRHPPDHAVERQRSSRARDRHGPAEEGRARHEARRHRRDRGHRRSRSARRQRRLRRLAQRRRRGRARLLDHGRSDLRCRRGRRAQAHHAPFSRRASGHGAHRPRLHRRRWRAEVRHRAWVQGRGSADRGVAREVAALEGADERYRRLGAASARRGAGLRGAAEEVGASRPCNARRSLANARESIRRRRGARSTAWRSMRTAISRASRRPAVWRSRSPAASATRR